MAYTKVQIKDLLAQYFPNKGYEVLSDLSPTEFIRWKQKREEWKFIVKKESLRKWRKKWRELHPNLGRGRYQRTAFSHSYNLKELRTANINWLMEHEDTSCSACGFHENFVAIDFHHHTKKENAKEMLSRIVNMHPEGFQKAWLEMRGKGCFLCANCHRILHHGI